MIKCKWILMFRRNNFLVKKISLIHSSTQSNILPTELSKNFVSQINFKSEKKLKVLFFGSDLLSVQILNGLNDLLKEKNFIQEISIITEADKSAKQINNQSNSNSDLKKNKVIEFCIQNNLNYHIWSSIKVNRSYESLFNHFHVGVVASFGHLIPSHLIQMMPL